MPTIERQCPCGSNSVCRQATQRLQGKLNGLWREPDVRKTVGLEAELKLKNHRPMRKPIKRPRWRLVEQAGICRCKGQARVHGLWSRGNYRYLLCLVSPHADHTTKPPGLPKEVQTARERPPSREAGIVASEPWPHHVAARTGAPRLRCTEADSSFMCCLETVSYLVSLDVRVCSFVVSTSWLVCSTDPSLQRQ